MAKKPVFDYLSETVVQTCPKKLIDELAFLQLKVVEQEHEINKLKKEKVALRSKVHVSGAQDA